MDLFVFYPETSNAQILHQLATSQLICNKCQFPGFQIIIVTGTDSLIIGSSHKNKTN